MFGLSLILMDLYNSQRFLNPRHTTHISMSKNRFFLLIALLLTACAPQPPQPSPGHLHSQLPQTTATDEKAASIPPVVSQAPFLPPPSSVAEAERYTVVVENIPLQSFLFALARDAKRNIEIAPGLKGFVTMNALDQTLEQILDRLVRQIEELRYDIINGDIVVGKDRPYVHTYKVDYVNLERQSDHTVEVSTQVVTSGLSNNQGGASSGGNNAGNNSTSAIKNSSKNVFWKSLLENIRSILKTEIIETEITKREANSEDNRNNSSNTAEITEQTIKSTIDNNVMVNKESGLMTVRATKRQHAEIQHFLDLVLDSVHRQVLIEATIVEVQLSDQYQAGIDWRRIDGNFSYEQKLTGGNISDNGPAYIFRYTNPLSAIGDISATVKLLESYGNTKVLSSPKIMALNNQTAILKAVDNQVYFTVNIEEREATNNTAGRTRFETEVHTVPEGLIMNITPQISANDEVILNIRPTVSRIVRYVNDPNPGLAQFGVTSPIPVVQVREMESLLRVHSGDVAIIGGLMQDSTKQGKDGVPVLSRLPFIGDAFSYRDDQYLKTELVIFLRPVVIKRASIEGDLKDYRRYLTHPDQPDRSPPTGLPLTPEKWYPPARR